MFSVCLALIMVLNKYVEKILGPLFFILAGFGYYLLMSSEASGNIISPWQTIHPAYIYVFLGTTIILGLLLAFSNTKVRYLLGFLIIYSFVLHAYLPLTHNLLYGADGWRHIASEAQLLDGHWPTATTLRDGSRDGFEVGDVAYGGFWIVSALVSKITTLNLVTVTKWLLPILWSIIFPILMFWLARSLAINRRLALLAVWFAGFPFALQAAGSFSLPVNFWLLIFLPLFILMLKEFSETRPRRKILLMSLIILGFGYTLYPVIFLIAWVGAEFSRIIVNKNYNSWWLVMVGLVTGLIIPVTELFRSGSRLVNFSELLVGIKQLVGNFIGWYLATGPRPHDIATGNIFFNQGIREQ